MLDMIADERKAENDFRIRLAGGEVEDAPGEPGSIDVFAGDEVWKAHQRAVLRKDSVNRRN